MGILDIFNIASIKRENAQQNALIKEMSAAEAIIKKENAQLNALIKEMGAADAITIKNKITEFQEDLKKIEEEKGRLNTEILYLQNEVKKKMMRY